MAIFNCVDYCCAVYSYLFLRLRKVKIVKNTTGYLWNIFLPVAFFFFYFYWIISLIPITLTQTGSLLQGYGFKKETMLVMMKWDPILSWLLLPVRPSYFPDHDGF